MRLYILSFACVVILSTNATADNIYQSGTLGATAVSWADVENQNVFGATLALQVFKGVRFNLEQSIVTTQIGGHFVGPPGTAGTLFGTIVKLDNEHDFPNSADLTTPDVLGSTVISYPEPSAELFGDIAVALDPGWYAVIFGSGLFGTAGHGAMPLNNPDIGSPTYISFQPGSDWRNLTNPIFRNFRFVVHGHYVPEPTTLGLSLFVLLTVAFCRTRHR